MRGVIVLLAGIVLFGSLIFGANLFGLAQYQFFAPRQEAIRRDTMLQSRAYGEAATRELYRLKLQYVQSKSDDERSTIAAMARHEATAFDRTLLPNDVQAWLTQIGG